jgi:hypothetical protein
MKRSEIRMPFPDFTEPVIGRIRATRWFNPRYAWRSDLGTVVISEGA